MAKRTKVDHGKPDWVTPGAFAGVGDLVHGPHGKYIIVFNRAIKIGRVFKNGVYAEGDNRPYDTHGLISFNRLKRIHEEDYVAYRDQLAREKAEREHAVKDQHEREQAIITAAPKVVTEAAHAIIHGYANGWDDRLSDEANVTHILNTLVRDVVNGRWNG